MKELPIETVLITEEQCKHIKSITNQWPSVCIQDYIEETLKKMMGKYSKFIIKIVFTNPLDHYVPHDYQYTIREKYKTTWSATIISTNATKTDITEIMIKYSKIKYSINHDVATVTEDRDLYIISDIKIMLSSKQEMAKPDAKVKIKLKASTYCVGPKVNGWKNLDLTMDPDNERFLWHNTPFMAVNGKEIYNKVLEVIKGAIQ